MMPEPTDWDGTGPHIAGIVGEAIAKPVVPLLRKFSEFIAPALARMARRASGEEKPIRLPWPVLDAHFGGGLWPGVHFVSAGTGLGKTQWALHVALHAAQCGTPALYGGLELQDFDLVLRVLGIEAHVPWSHLWTGNAGADTIARALAAVPALRDLPLHQEVKRPQGFSAKSLCEIVEALRELYPEEGGPGSRPLLVVVDFLQIIGDEQGDEHELRERIGRASYAMRELSMRLSVAFVVISAVARERYKLMNDLHTEAKLIWEADGDDCPIKRHILNPESIVGAGKESGEIEYSGDSVTVIGRVPETYENSHVDCIVATAKGRATGAMWSPLHFTGFAFEECSDRGGRIVEAWGDAGAKREERKAVQAEAKLAAKEMALSRDVEAVVAFVRRNPGCSVAEARASTVNDSARRWSPVVDALGVRLARIMPKKKTDPVRLSLVDGGVNL